MTARFRFLVHFMAVGLFAANAAFGELKLGHWFAPHMVMQREAPIPVWGSASSGSEIWVELRKGEGGEGDIITSGTASADHSGKWRLHLDPQSASDGEIGYTMLVRTATEEIQVSPVHVGDLWVCAGQSNMNFLMRPHLPWSEGVLDWENEVAAAGDPLLNIFTTIPHADWREAEDVKGSWRPDDALYAGHFSAVPYLFGRELRRETGVPIGVIVAALGATSIKSWMHIDALEPLPAAQADIQLHADRRAANTASIQHYDETAFSAYIEQSLVNHWQPAFAAAYPDPYPNWRHQPGGLYHGMLVPLEGVPVKAVAWYQGETDSTQHATYADYLSALISSWRMRRGHPDLPFLVVQIANHDPVLTGADPAIHANTRAALREAQTKALEFENTALIVTADVGHPTNIHPRDKQSVAYRLSLAALNLAYGIESTVYQGPAPTGMEVTGDGFLLHWETFGAGLVVDRERATGFGSEFEIAGADQKFFPAEIRHDEDQFILWSDSVDNPVHLRYAWDNNPRLIVFNEMGLPTAPFRISLPMQTLVDFGFDDRTLAASESDTAIAEAELIPGPGVTATGFSSVRGVPPPSWFIRTTSTPADLESAIRDEVYLELSVRVYPGYQMSLDVGGFAMQIARSTGLGEFHYAVRSDLDGFTRDLANVKIETGNEQFGDVHVALPPTGLRESLRVRVYFWDDWNDSQRVFRVDNLRLIGTRHFLPETRIESLPGSGEVRVVWEGAPQRRYKLHLDRHPKFSSGEFSVQVSDPINPEGVGEFFLNLADAPLFLQVREDP